MASTPVSQLPSGRPGLATLDHLAPFQCKIRVWNVNRRVTYSPTAHALRAESTLTADSELTTRLGSALGTLDHLLPSHPTIRVRNTDVPPHLPAQYSPTAQARRADTTATDSSAASEPGLGLATRDQARPFHRAISAWIATAFVAQSFEHHDPAANARLRDTAATPAR